MCVRFGGPPEATHQPPVTGLRLPLVISVGVGLIAVGIATAIGARRRRRA